MAVVNINDEFYGWISAISGIITFIITILLFVQHVKQLRNQIKQRNELKWNWLFSFSLILFCSVIIAHISWFWGTFKTIESKIECYWLISIASICYILVKWSLYMFLTIRLETSFANSFYEFNKTILNIWRLILILSIISAIILILIYSNPTLHKNKSNHMFDVECRSNFEIFILIHFGITDFIACFINLYLFTKQLYKISNSMKNNNTVTQLQIGNNSPTQSVDQIEIVTFPNNKNINNKQNYEPNKQQIDQLLGIIKKQTILTAIGVISTLMAMIFLALFSLPVVWYVSFCIILNIIHKLCAFVHVIHK